VRTPEWRYIRYENGDEELYDEKKDPNEHTNLAGKPEFAAKKTELAKFLPTQNQRDLGPPGTNPSSSEKKGGKGGKRKKAE
jgi:hypothetical protein